MFKFLLLLFLAVPLIEIYLLLKIGSLIGVVPPILTVVATAVIGVWLLRIQGVSTLRRVQTTLDRGEIPAIEMVESMILLFGGMLLLTPGFFTDAIGFLCLIPVTRQRIALYLLKNRFEPAINRDATGGTTQHATLEGEFRREEKE